MNNFCTITTYDHLYKVFALADSIHQTSADAMLHVLCIDKNDIIDVHSQCIFYQLSDLEGQPAFEQIKSKYHNHSDKIRWSLKPIFLHYLLNNAVSKVIYIDNDIYFFGDYSFLFDLLDIHSFLLTPHHYPRDPKRDQNWLEANYKVGLYNAGFVGVNTEAKKHLLWWAECCAYRCEKNPMRGTFDDQKYLDLMPIVAEDTLVLKHKGCNVAEWNRLEIKRSVKDDGSVWLDNIFPLIFVHFNHTTIRAVDRGAEPCLNLLLDRYMANLKKYNPGIKVAHMIRPDKMLDRIKYYIWKKATDLNL